MSSESAAPNHLSTPTDPTSTITTSPRASLNIVRTVSIEDKTSLRKPPRNHSRRNSVDRTSTHTHSHRTLVEQVQHWITKERNKQAAKKEKRALRKSEKASGIFKHHRHHRLDEPAKHHEATHTTTDDEKLEEPTSPTTTSSSGADDIDPASLLELESLLLASAVDLHAPTHKRSSRKLRHLPSKPNLDPAKQPPQQHLPPSCEEVLEIPEKIGKDAFKLEVLKLAHTLKCKRWRHVPLESSKELVVRKISGAMTNAVFMVVPPAAYAFAPPANETSTTGGSSRTPRAIPKLLLRIYGPNVSHLIDRATELHILTRLAKRNIGPRLLGTFSNGRFEEFLDSATTLTRTDIRDPSTSRNIAKRMCELHTGMNLEAHEREAGAGVLRNWWKWKKRAAERTLRKDAQGEGFVCHKPWAEFEKAVETYIRHVYKECGGEEELKKQLCFTHNDTQYGNILRVDKVPPTPALPDEHHDSKQLALPDPKKDEAHKKLTIIDFEYASANPRGFDLANHFCEWMADYHCDTPHLMNGADFPTQEEKERFVRAYVEHSFHLSERDASETEIEEEVKKVLKEVELWVGASNVMWCAWGIVQAKEEEEANGVGIAELDTGRVVQGVNGTGAGAEVEEEEGGEFDYWGYAGERARHFWGEFERLGLSVEA
ncbi:kinase-like protein [Ascobolus immersus RN42]|uniref:Kinase-like protein n=1 Tax=Ascobolus immersus RN42 TaxID=1160509 RepID=A0A3N4HSH1_ASCIM|nr:kinase-like protein [Ascobolus immersus RN42]